MGSAGIRVFGLGSPHGDDQIGWRLVDALRARLEGLEVEMESVATPLDVMGRVGERGTLVLLDACRGEGPVGSVRWIEVSQIGEASGRAATSHGFGLHEMLRLADVLGRTPERVVVLAVEAGEMAPGDEMSATLRARFSSIVDEAERLVRGLAHEARAVAAG